MVLGGQRVGIGASVSAVLPTGLNTVTLVVTDALGNTDADTTSVRVNERPSVSAPTNIIAFVGTSVDLAGTAGDDGFPGPLSVAWSQREGPGTISFADASSLTGGATFPVPGTYELRLTANDGVLSGSVDITVRVVAAGSDITYLEPVEDAYVRGGTFSGNNYGNATTLPVLNSTNPDNSRRSFLSFDRIPCQLGPNKRVVIDHHLQARCAHALHPVNDDSWSEATITRYGASGRPSGS